MKCGSRAVLTALIIVSLSALLLMAGCQSSGSGKVITKSQAPIRATPSAASSESFSPSCTEQWICDGNTRYLVGRDCSRSDETYCSAGCSEGRCLTEGHSSTEVEEDDADKTPVQYTNAIPDDYSEDVDLRKTVTYTLEEGEDITIRFDGESFYVKALVINEVDERVKLKVDGDISYGIPEGGTIILKAEDDEDDELVIEIVELKTGKDSTYRGPKKVLFRLAKIVQ